MKLASVEKELSMVQELREFCGNYPVCEGCPVNGICYPGFLFLGPPLDARVARLYDMYHAMKSYQKQQKGESYE